MMFPSILLLLPCLVVSTFASHQNWPGTSTRPVLSNTEASQYTKEKYLDGWTPSNIQTTKEDYIVGPGHYTYIQQAIHAAIKDGGTTRKYIHIQKGNYGQIIFIPQTTVPLTIYGTPSKAEEVYISLEQSGNMAGSDWAKRVNPNGAVFKEGDAGWKMYSDCAKKATIGLCNALIWAEADNLEIADLTVDNPSKDGQAQAARSHGDKQNWYNVHFYGFQDTLLADGGKRIYFNSPTIKGDVDFIFGDARAVFENAQIIARADRPRTQGTIFAPDTDDDKKYGFLAINSKITAESGIASAHGCNLARAWDASSKQGKDNVCFAIFFIRDVADCYVNQCRYFRFCLPVSPSPSKICQKANGQLVIRECEIVDVINIKAPYAAATGGKRPYAGNADVNRNLDDKNYNRFWEYKNTGSEANGQLVIRECEIVDVIKVNAPYATAAGGRPYAGNDNVNRDLDDKNYNRFWEYKNTGSGA